MSKVRNKKGRAIHSQSESLYTMRMTGQMEYDFVDELMTMYDIKKNMYTIKLETLRRKRRGFPN